MTDLKETYTYVPHLFARMAVFITHQVTNNRLPTQPHTHNSVQYFRFSLLCHYVVALTILMQLIVDIRWIIFFLLLNHGEK